MAWLEIEVERKGDEVRVSARGSRGERPAPHTLVLAQGIETLTTLASKVGRAVRARRELDPTTIELAQTIHAEFLNGELRDVLARLTDPSRSEKNNPRENRLLVRLFVQDRTLLSVPWEVLCKPKTTEGFWGMDPHVLVTRGAHSPDPWGPREVSGAVRVMAIAPTAGEPSLAVLRGALGPAIDAGEIEWLDPITGPNINAKVLFDRLRRGQTPHILHWIGHGGVDANGRPSLRLADDEDGEETWLTTEALARELSPHFLEDLRLVVLEACEGAKAGMFSSAAEELAMAGADAVVAYLWPVRADVAQTCSSEMYRSLTVAGDIGTSIAAARRTLITQSAEAFSPVLFLRGSDSVLFDYSRRKVVKPRVTPERRVIAPALQTLLDKPPYTIVLGNGEEDRAALHEELLKFLKENNDIVDSSMAFGAITQRCVMRWGGEVLHSLFQQTIAGSSSENLPPFIRALGALVPPGVHVTLAWRPYLEKAIAEQQPQKTIYAIQASLSGNNTKPRIIRRAAGTTVWKMEPSLPKYFDVDDDIVVLRMYGGYSPEVRPIFSPPVLTEDDHVHGLLGERPPQWLEELLARPRIQPALLIGLSAFDWQSRLLLWWLYDKRPAPKDSVIVLTSKVDPTEPEVWDSDGGLPGMGRVAAVMADPSELALGLEGLTASEGLS